MEKLERSGANASAALATLTYIGRKGAEPLSRSFSAVTGAGSLGFLPMIWSGHLASKIAETARIYAGFNGDTPVSGRSRSDP
jgi:hypothetical protein